MVRAKDGTIITQAGKTISCSDGSRYFLSGKVLSGPHGTVSRNVGSPQEALAIVIGLHGGQR